VIVIIIERLRGESIIAEDHTTELKRYLLGQMGEPEEERLEMRLVSDPGFVEEFDMMVDEITAAYVAGQFAGAEKEQVERYFLRSPERRTKLEFMAELLHQVGAAREEQPPIVLHDKRPSFSDRIRAFWARPYFAPGFATVAIAVILVGGALWFSRSGGPTPTRSFAVTLSASNAERSTTDPAPKIESFKLPPDVNELHLELLLPSPPTQPVSYRADFVSPVRIQGLTIVGQDSRAVVIAVPAAELKSDRYVVQLFMIFADGHEERVPGNYYFRVE